NVVRLGVPNLSFHGSALAIYELAPKETRTQPAPFEFKLMEGYLRYDSDDEKNYAQAGRQLVFMGVVREFVDGIYVHHLFGDRLGVELVGGHPVETEKADCTGDFM